jgi:pimeloyl-ACP methyl ester carboxylesterase
MRSHPQQTKGIVLVDAASAYLKDVFTASQWTGWTAANAAAHAASPDLESPDYDKSIEQLRDAGPMPRIPAAVLSSDQPWDLGITPSASTWPAWREAQARLAVSLRATHVTETDSGHGIAVEQPTLVVTAIQRVIEQTRR